MSGFEERPFRKHKSKNKDADHDKKSQQQPKHSDDKTPVSLGEQLRQWAQDHDWHQGGHIHNHLALKRAFLRKISTAVDEFLSHSQIKLALQVKGDFDALLKLVKRFDKRFYKGFSEDYELQACEQLQEQIYAAIDDIAALLDNRDLHNDSPGVPSASTAVPFNPDHWVTFGQASEILVVSKPTLTRWVNEGKLSCNGQTGRGRKLSKISVLLHKQSLEDREIIEDAKDLRRDEKRLDALHRR